VRNSFLKEFNDEEAGEVINEVVDICEVDCRDKGVAGGEGSWAMIYMRLRVLAILE
jgi:hypothetical protein